MNWENQLGMRCFVNPTRDVLILTDVLIYPTTISLSRPHPSINQASILILALVIGQTVKNVPPPFRYKPTA